jgi:hypothetical protein
MTYTIAEPCIDVKDRVCEPACPVTAIFYEDDVPAEWKRFTPINAEWFGDAVSGEQGSGSGWQHPRQGRGGRDLVRAGPPLP